VRRYGDVVAVDQVSLDIEKGELFFLLGPSGCGKTTILRMIAGFCPLDEGEVFFDERPMKDVPAHKRNVPMVFQSYALWPHMTVRENVQYGLDVRGLSREDKRRNVDAALDMVQMLSFADRKPNQLSGGQQQRVALARALVVEPDALLLDEPLSNLDAKLRLEMRNEIRRIHQETRLTTVYVTHDQKESLSLAERVAVMNQGRVEQLGAPRELYNAPVSRFVAEFLGEVNMLPGKVQAVGPGKAVVVQTKLGRVESARGGDSVILGQEVFCAIRPEAITVGSSKGDGGRNRFAVSIQSRTYLGEMEQFLLRTPEGQEVKALCLNPKLNRTGGDEAIAASFAPEDVMILTK
jgi:ABC-type Fe3+/spermidine/putrescine transport system ATPase subunit